MSTERSPRILQSTYCKREREKQLHCEALFRVIVWKLFSKERDGTLISQRLPPDGSKWALICFSRQDGEDFLLREKAQIEI